MERLFLRIYDFFAARPRRFLAFVLPLILSLLFIWGGSKIVMNEDIAGFLPYKSSKNGGNNQGQFIYKNLRMQDKVVLLFSLANDADFEGVQEREAILSAAAEQFADAMEAADIEGIKEPQLRIDALQMLQTTRFILSNMPYFLDKQDYDRIDSILRNGDIVNILEQNRAALVSSSGPFIKDIVLSDPLRFSSSLLGALNSLSSQTDYKLIGDYLFTADSTTLIMNFSSEYGGSETARNKQMISAVKAIADSVAKDNPMVSITLTGSPVIAVANAGRIQKDALRAGVLSIALIVLLLGWYFKSIKPIFLICAPVVFGILLGLCYMGLFHPNLSSIALTACCVIFGIGVDYALLYSTRLRYATGAREALGDIASPMVIGNITTVGAFLSLLVMSAEGMRDFGLFAALSLIGAILFVVLFLPHWAGKAEGKEHSGALSKWVNLRPERSRYLFWGIVALTALFLLLGSKVRFSADFNKINYISENQSAALEQLQQSTNRGGNVALYVVSEGPSLDSALAISEKSNQFITEALSNGYSTAVASVGNFLPSKQMQKQRLAMWSEFAGRCSAEIIALLEKNSAKAGFAPNAFEPFKHILTKEYAIQNEEFFAPLTSSVLKPFLLKDSSSAIVLSTLYTPKERVAELYSRFGERSGSFLFDSYSMTEQMLSTLQKDFDWVLFICSILVFIFLTIAFRRIELALTAFLPMVVSWIWITGIMGITGVDFNIVNIILATFIFGLGDDYTIFMVEGLQYEHTHNKQLLSSYKTGVTLSALTMLIGLGSMYIALHPALRSLAQVAVIGMICVVAMAFILPPYIFSFLTTVSYKGKRYMRFAPLRLSDIAVTLYCIVVFALASLWARVKLLFNPKMDSGKFRSLVQRAMEFFAKHFPRTTLTIEGVDSKMFESPSVIICNHQSHLDLIYLLSLSDKITVLTGKWAYNSPIYGEFVRKAGFICIEDGLESSMAQIQQRVGEGFSIVIFPEGTRSEDYTIGHFHNGAFEIAERLQLPIQPLLIYGAGELMPKRELFARRADIAIKALPRVPYSKLNEWGERPLKQAHAFRKYYQAEYNALAEQVRTPKWRARRQRALNIYKQTT